MESHRLHVLVVEDDTDIRTILAQELAEIGMETSTARDGREALDRLHQEETLPDVIISNVDMPRLDGGELLFEVRGDASLHDIPFVLMTAEFTDHHSFIDADAVLRKPFELDELVAVIYRVHRRRQLQASPWREEERGQAAHL